MNGYADSPSNASTAREQATEQFDRMAANVESTAETIAERGREVAGNVRSAVERSMREQPITTLLLTAAVGFVVGALWKS